MKYFKFILITVVILLVSSIGAIAQDQAPDYYVGDNGDIKSVPTSVKQIGSSSSPLEFSETQNPDGSTGTWYWGATR